MSLRGGGEGGKVISIKKKKKSLFGTFLFKFVDKTSTAIKVEGVGLNGTVIKKTTFFGVFPN